jgi:uncharacterized protein (DUF58 family)
MWLAAVNYSNNLVYAVLYLTASLTFVSMFHTRRNLAALQVDHVRILPAFAGEEVRMEIFLRNTSSHTVYGLYFLRLGEEPEYRWKIGQPLADLILSRRLRQLRTPGRRSVRVEPEDSVAAEVTFPSERRGLYRFESLQVRTSFPFGLIWASFRLPLNADYYIYPKPQGSTDWPALTPSGTDGSHNSNLPGDDFAGVRAYAPGDTLRHVDWKAYARGRPLSIKQFTGGAGQELWLDAASLDRMPLEPRLSQLALWIVNAEKEELPYALKLGRVSLPLGVGAAQARRALEALAVAGHRPPEDARLIPPPANRSLSG